MLPNRTSDRLDGLGALIRHIAPPSGTPIAFRASSAVTGDFASNTDVTVTAPVGLVDGDLIIVALGVNDPMALGASPGLNGFTVVTGNWVDTSGSDGSGLVMYKIAASEGASWNFTNLLNTLDAGTWASVAYTGVNSTTPLDVTSTTNTPTTTTTPAGSAIVPVTNNCMIVGVFCCDPTAGLTGTADTSPAATERVDHANGSSGYVFLEDFLQTTAASVILDMTASATDTFSVFLLALRPA